MSASDCLVFSLSSLDNVIQFGIALMLAYLNLERFRYRKSAPKKAYQALQNSKTNNISDINQYEEYTELEETTETLKKIETNFEFSDLEKIKSKYTKFLVIYFGKNIDRWLTVIFSLILAIILIINTQYNSMLYQFLSQYQDLLFWLILFFSVFPVINTVLGKSLNKKLHSIANKKISNLTNAIKTIIQTKEMAMSNVTSKDLKLESELNEN